MSQHHSFDIKIATVYGIDCAIIIHHFLHWIGVNQRKGKNFHEGRTWSFQTIDDIVAHFPYFTKDQVVNIIEKLCTGKCRNSKNKEFEPILMKGNFEKNKFDRTTWYAFIKDPEIIEQKKDSNNFTDNVVLQNGECDTTKSENVVLQNVIYTDPKQDAKTDCLFTPPVGGGVLNKFSKIHFDGHEVKCSLQEVFQYAISEKKNWKTEEIISSWKILEEYNGAIRCYLHFIDGTIENIKKKEKSELAIKNKGKKWMSTEESKNIQEKVVISYPTQQEGLPSHIPSKKEKSTECSPSYWERIFQAPV